MFTNREDEHRWNVIAEPDHEVTQRTFWRFHRGQGSNRHVLNCAVPVARAHELTDFAMPANWSFDKCLITSGTGNFPAGLGDWRYTPKIKPEAQLPQMAKLSSAQSKLIGSPWFQSPSQAAGMALNARHLRYHYDLWQDIKPQVLRGLHTTLVYVTPQIGFALTPHIQLQRAFRYLASLSRFCGPAQLFPAKYIYPVANLGGLADMPAPIFADILPATGGVSFPVIECTPDPWGVLAYFDRNESYYGFPFSHMTDSDTDVTLHDIEEGAMLLPTGERVRARESESYLYATMDPSLHPVHLDTAAYNRGHKRFLIREQRESKGIRTMNTELESESSLKELEEEVLGEGREWTRQRLEQRLQQRADRIGARFSPREEAAGAPAAARPDAAYGGRGGKD